MRANTQQIFIIGQGLAGSVLAYLLHSAGHQVLIIDDAHSSSASKVAAGMWNPLSFVRNNPVWLAELLLQSMYQVYTAMEKELNISFFHPTELVRIFPNVRAANDWDVRSTRPDMKPYVLDKQDEAVQQQITQTAGHAIIQGSGWLDVPLLLASVQKFFVTLGKLQMRFFTDDDLKKTYSQFPNARFVFCTGASMRHSSLFSNLDLRALKGEVITIAAHELQLNRMVHFRKFLIPRGDGTFKLGSTHELNFKDNNTSEQAKQELLAELNNVYKGAVQVTEHRAGLRPTTHDRNPVMGFLASHPHIGCFNGFGSRGVLMVPYFAQQFMHHIEYAAPLIKVVDVARYGL